MDESERYQNYSFEVKHLHNQHQQNSDSLTVKLWPIWFLQIAKQIVELLFQIRISKQSGRWLLIAMIVNSLIGAN